MTLIPSSLTKKPSQAKATTGNHAASYTNTYRTLTGVQLRWNVSFSRGWLRSRSLSPAVVLQGFERNQSTANLLGPKLSSWGLL